MVAKPDENQFDAADIEAAIRKLIAKKFRRWSKAMGITSFLAFASIAYYLLFSLPETATEKALNSFRKEVNLAVEVFKPAAQAAVELENRVQTFDRQLETFSRSLESQIATLTNSVNDATGQVNANAKAAEEQDREINAIRDSIVTVSSRLSKLDPSAIERAESVVSLLESYPSETKLIEDVEHALLDLRSLRQDLAASVEIQFGMNEQVGVNTRRIFEERDALRQEQLDFYRKQTDDREKEMSERKEYQEQFNDFRVKFNDFQEQVLEILKKQGLE